MPPQLIDRIMSVRSCRASTYRYDPYGNTIGSTGTGRNPFRFTGTYLDGVTDLYQMGARYYKTGWGRFTQADPLGSSVSLP